MKKVCIVFISVLLLLAGCTMGPKKDEVVQKKDDNNANQEPSIVPSYQLTDNTYKIILPYKPNAARGAISHQIGNRLDVNEMEKGLRRLSKPTFDPDKNFYQEGQYLSQDKIYELIDQLNPKKEKKFSKGTTKEEKIDYYKKHPRSFSHILEQDYVKKDKDNHAKLAGVSIGIAIKSEYTFNLDKNGKPGPTRHADVSEAAMLKKGKQVAKRVLSEMRKMKELKNVPILIALYREEAPSSPIPGSYVAKTLVKSGGNAIGKWGTIKDDNVLFPSARANKDYIEDAQLIASFEKEVQKYFPNYVGVAGKGFYHNDELSKLTLTIPIEFYDEGEVIGFTQYVYGLIKEIFPNYFDLEIRVKSNKNLESFLYRDKGKDDPVAHILD